MEMKLLIESALGLTALLVVLVYFLLFSFKKKKVEKKVLQPKPKEKENRDLEHLRLVIKKRSSTSEELKKALDLIIKYHGTIHPKLGVRTHPDFDIYMDILFSLCRHPNTNKNLILDFDRELERLNPAYKIEINDALSKGLNSRGM
jgi:hypothetical protein